MDCSQAKQIRIDEFLAQLGYSPAKVSTRRITYRSMLAQSGDRSPSFQVSVDGHAYHDWSTGFCGNIIDLAMRILGTTSVSTALAYIDEVMGHPTIVTPPKSFSFRQREQSAIDILSVEHLSAPALLHYAWVRGISSDVIKAYCSEVHYRINGGREYYSIGWANASGGWELRNAYSKLSTTPKDITVVNDLCGCTMLLFEGFFDFLSAVRLRWFRPNSMNAVVLNSTALLDRAIHVLQDASRIICLLDNDDSGRRTTERIMQACSQAEDHSHLYSRYNDVNDALPSIINNRNYK